MMDERFERLAILLGAHAMETLATRRVLLFGVGGVGGFCAEALCRSGVSRMTLVDGDRVAPSNINRQIVALTSTLGAYKTDVMRARMLDINPCAQVDSIPAFFKPESAPLIDFAAYDLVIDAIDDIPAKVLLAARAEADGTPCLSCMGAGNKLGPARFEAADLFETSVCPLARKMRKAAREAGVTSLRVLYTKEPPVARVPPEADAESGRPVPGSAVFVTAAAGLALAGEAVRMLLA